MWGRDIPRCQMSRNSDSCFDCRRKYQVVGLQNQGNSVKQKCSIHTVTKCSICIRMSSQPMLDPTSMHRLTARLLLIVLAMGAFGPGLQALSSEPAHACCLRRLHAHGQGNAFHDATKSGGNCCPPLITPQSAQVTHPDNASFDPLLVELDLQPEFPHHAAGCTSRNSTRAPPKFA